MKTTAKAVQTKIYYSKFNPYRCEAPYWTGMTYSKEHESETYKIYVKSFQQDLKELQFVIICSYDNIHTWIFD